MIRMLSSFACLITLFSWGQMDTAFVETDSSFVQEDYLPLKVNGEWVWYDVANNRPSDLIFISNAAHGASGAYFSFSVRDSTHWGILDSAGDTLQPFIFDSIIEINNHLLTRSNNQWSYHSFGVDFIDSLIPISFDSLYFDGMYLYYFDSGKTGLIMGYGKVIPAKYDGIRAFECTSGRHVDRHFISLSGTEYNLINTDGEELLPKGIWDLRCTEDGVFEFRRDEHPEYFLAGTNEVITPNGRDIVFYSERGYKIYSVDTSRSELHLASGEVLKDVYDDYFLLGNNFIAVRKNGKVGLTRNGTQVLSEIKYDQINPISQPYQWDGEVRQYFRYYIGDSCGLMDDQGRELFGAKYANILHTNDEERWIVLDGNLAGVVDKRGRTLIPTKYQRIDLENASKQFIVQHHSKIGLFDYNGQQKLPIEYDGYRTLQSFADGDYRDAILAFKKGGKYYFANSKGFLDPVGFDHFDHSTDVLKTYTSKAISVFLFDQRGGIEERSNYPIYRNTIIKKDYHDRLSTLSGWDVSELEENQQAGYFGLRYYQKRGFGVPPTYRTIRSLFFNDFLGEVPAEITEYQLTKEISVEVVKGFHLLWLATGRTNAVNYFSSELAWEWDGSGDRFINRTANGKQDRAYGIEARKVSIDLTEKIHFSDLADWERRYRRYFKGGEAILCQIDSADISLYELYRYYNSVDGCRATPEVMKTILNPTVGVRFKNAKCEVINSSDYDINRGYRSFNDPVSFQKFEHLERYLYFEHPLDEKTGNLRSNLLPKNGKTETIVDKVLNASTVRAGEMTSGGSYILAEIQNSQLAKIHTDYPTYFFRQDSINLSYEAGRITRRIDSSTVRLLRPDGEIIADSCIMVRYLNEERFAVLHAGGWRLIDRDGNFLTRDFYSGVSEFEENRAEFRFSNGSAIEVDTNGKQLAPLPEPRTFLDEDYYYHASNPAVIIHRSSLISDQAQEGEKYLSKGFFVSKVGSVTRVRRFGSSQKIELTSDAKVKSFGSCLYYQKGKHLYSVDSNLMTTKFKKTDKFRTVTPEIGWLQGKSDQLIDANWKSIRRMSDDERFELRDGELIVFENDSVFTNYGSLKVDNSSSEERAVTQEVKVVFEEGKFGVKKGEETILPFDYSWLSKVNDQEFMTKIDSEWHLYDVQLRRIGNRPYDRFIETAEGNFVFFYRDQIFVLDRQRSSYRFIR